MRRRWVIVVLALTLALPTSIRADDWTVSRPESRIRLSVRALGMTQVGRFEDWNAAIRLDPTAPETARVQIDLRTASLKMNTASLTSRAIGPRFLDADRYPSIGFRLLSLTRNEVGPLEATADVTVKGQTRRVRFPIDLRITGETAQMTGGFSLDRASLGIGTDGPWNGMISRQVRVDVALRARRAG